MARKAGFEGSPEEMAQDMAGAKAMGMSPSGYEGSPQDMAEDSPFAGGGALPPAAPPTRAPRETTHGGGIEGRMPSAPVHRGHRRGRKAPIQGGRHPGHTPR